MAVRRRAPQVSAEFEALFEKPGAGWINIQPYRLGQQAVDVEGKTVWVVPEDAIKEQANVVEGLTQVVSSANALDRNLALVYAGLRKFRRMVGKGVSIIPFRHGVESEGEDDPRTVVGGHIQYYNPSWRVGVYLNPQAIIDDSQKIRAHALPFIYVDAGVERVCRLKSPCVPSERLYLRHKTLTAIPKRDRHVEGSFPVAESMDIMLSAEELHDPRKKTPVDRLILEVRNPPAGPVMGKHALDVMVAAGKLDNSGGFRVPRDQRKSQWTSLEDKLARLPWKAMQQLWVFRVHGMGSVSQLSEHLNSIPEQVMGQQLRQMKDVVDQVLTEEQSDSENQEYPEYARTVKSAARLRYRAPVRFNGNMMTLRDAYATHYLANRSLYDSADPAIHEWVRAAADNGFSYTDYRLALRAFFDDKERFNWIVDRTTAACFDLGSTQETGCRPTMGAVLTSNIHGLRRKENEYLRGLSVFFTHRHSRDAVEGSAPENVEVISDLHESVTVRVAASSTGELGELLDAGFMYADAGRLVNHRGYFDLEYNRRHPRSRELREGLQG